MKASTQEVFAYCRDLVRRCDEDRWLAAHYAPPVERNALCVLYALHIEIERIPSLVSEPPLGEIRLQWWREAIDEIARNYPRDHPVAQAAHTGAIVDGALREAFGRAIDARARFLYSEPFESCDELAAFLRRAEAFVAALAARRLAPSLDESGVSAVMDAALAYAMARYGRSLAPALTDEIVVRAENLRRRAAPVLRALPATVMPAFAHFSLTGIYLRRSRGPSPVSRRLKVFAAVASGRV